MKHREDLFPHSDESYLNSFTLVSIFKIVSRSLSLLLLLFLCGEEKPQTFLINNVPAENIIYSFFFCFLLLLAVPSL